ncbi:MAG: hypothetical protein IJJ47_11445 [Methanosphaera sp.]|nr:hypothetical protein [Methanosphaera sp.]
MDESESITLFNITPEEYKIIEKLRNEKRVFTALMTEEINDTVYTNECELIVQKEILKIIKYDSNENEWRGNSFIYFKSVDFTSTLKTYNKNFLTINIKGSKFLFEFDTPENMFECYKELTRRTNMQHQK